MATKKQSPRDPESERPLRYSALNGTVMDGERTMFRAWQGTDEQARLFAAALNDAATEASSDRDSPPAAAREDDAGDGSTRADALDPYDVVEDSRSDIDSWVRDDIRIPEIAEKIIDQGEFSAMYGALWRNRIGRGAIHALSKAAVAKSARSALERRPEGSEPPEDAPIDESAQGAPPGGVLDRASDGPTAGDVLRRALREADTRKIHSCSDPTDLQKAEVNGAIFVIRILNRLLATIEGRLINARFKDGRNVSFIIQKPMLFEGLDSALVAQLSGRSKETPTGWAVVKYEQEETR